ncbi:MAG: AAA family ATPase [Paraprevotella sp.]|nr:AAA family ATPase [Paraprevotella sp.]
MINKDLEGVIAGKCPFTPTEGQRKVIAMMADFLLSGDKDGVCLLRGYAGTGKTSVMGALVMALSDLKQKTVLLAPTGRAAKVFALHSGHAAFTIHKRIYRQKSFSNETDKFLQNVNLQKDTLVIVVEASMISGSAGNGWGFGSGCLLDDLVHFVYSGEGCSLMLVGDAAQLPPVGEELSPALSSTALKGYGLHVWEGELTQVVRQHDTSGILWNATRLRQLITSDDCTGLPGIRFQGFPDIRSVPGDELIETLEESYSRCGLDQTIIVTRSNKRANIYNNGVRGRILGREEELTGGDQLLIAKNNYFWVGGQKDCPFDFLANGDVAVVRRVRRTRELYGFRFADVLLRFPDYDDVELETTVLLDTLQSEAPALTREQADALFRAVEEDYAEITVRRERLKKLKSDPYFNALQVKYAYAVTCHKAQGGQWQRVFVDQGYVTEDMLTADYLRWLYTAFTRATDVLYLVNWPASQTEGTTAVR